MVLLNHCKTMIYAIFGIIYLVLNRENTTF